MEGVQIVLSSGSPFRPKGLAHRLHLLHPPGILVPDPWPLISPPRATSPDTSS